MRTFACQSCGQAVYFENWRCNHCGAALGFLPDALQLVAVEKDAAGFWTPITPCDKAQHSRYLRSAPPRKTSCSSRRSSALGGERMVHCTAFNVLRLLPTSKKSGLTSRATTQCYPTASWLLSREMCGYSRIVDAGPFTSIVLMAPLGLSWMDNSACVHWKGCRTAISRCSCRLSCVMVRMSCANSSS